MKKIVLLLFILCSSFCYSQNINFMGIPLGTPFTRVKQQLIEKGFKYDTVKSNKGNYPNFHLFDGYFAGEVATLSVAVTPRTETVYMINVRFMELAHNTLGTGVSEDYQFYKYNNFKNSICKKHPSIAPREYALEEYPHMAFWETDNWKIRLVISWVNKIWRELDLSYIDIRAEEKNKEEIESDF